MGIGSTSTILQYLEDKAMAAHRSNPVGYFTLSNFALPYMHTLDLAIVDVSLPWLHKHKGELHFKCQTLH